MSPATNGVSSAVHLSPTEERIIEIIKRTGPTNSVELAKRYYGRDAPEHAVQYIANSIRKLEAKTMGTRGLRVKRGKRTGPHPMEVWLEK